MPWKKRRIASRPSCRPSCLPPSHTASSTNRPASWSASYPLSQSSQYRAFKARICSAASSRAKRASTVMVTSPCELPNMVRGGSVTPRHTQRPQCTLKHIRGFQCQQSELPAHAFKTLGLEGITDWIRSVVVFSECREALRHYPTLRDNALVDKPGVAPRPVGAWSEQHRRIAALNVLVDHRGLQQMIE